METATTKKEYTIDATGKKLGRVATDVATALLGKKEGGYAPNQVANVKVTVTNASKLDINEKKKNEKVYISHSGYPGGQKLTPLSRILDRKGYSEALMRAVKGMLPKNKLQSRRLKNLNIEE